MKVMFVDDSLVMRRLLRAFLQKWNYEVVEAENGAQAWELFQKEPVPLVLTDWMMPEMDGVELVKRIRAAKRPGYTYVVLLTSKSDKEDLVTAMDAGADDFLIKPVEHQELRVRLREGERIVRLEQTLQSQNKQLREAQAVMVEQEKLASLGHLAAGMAHEINNPIAFVANNLVVLQRDTKALLNLIGKYRQGFDTLQAGKPELATEVRKLEDDLDFDWVNQNVPELYTSCLSGLGRVRDIVKNLREFSRLDQAQFDQVNLNEALETTAEIIRYELNTKQITLTKKLGEIPTVHCSPSKINQMLLNLLTNAIQASPPGSAIEIRSEWDGEYVVLEIEDHGSGIAKENLDHIFEPFFTTKPVGQGTGLGLSMSYSTVRDHGGTISVESEVGSGTTFRIRLPLRPPAKEANQ